MNCCTIGFPKTNPERRASFNIKQPKNGCDEHRQEVENAKKEVKLIHFDTLKKFHSIAMNDSSETKGEKKKEARSVETCVDGKLLLIRCSKAS